MDAQLPSIPVPAQEIAALSGVADSPLTLYDAASLGGGGKSEKTSETRLSSITAAPLAAKTRSKLKRTNLARPDVALSHHLSDHSRMKPQPYDGDLAGYVDLALELCRATEAGALLVMLSGPTEWDQLKDSANSVKIVVAADSVEELTGATEAGLPTIVVGMEDAPVIEKLTQALLNGVAREILHPGGGVVVIYSGFEADTIDSISFVRLDEHLGRLTARDLRQLETSVPLETLKTVVDLAVEIGREGREGKPVGTMFVVGDTRKVLAHCQPAGFDPVKGYSRGERDLFDPRVRDAVKEVAGLDGAFIVAPDGTVEKAAQLVDAPYANLTLSKGLGSRHWAGAAISKSTHAIAIVISQSSGTVRLFQNGEVVLRIEPFRQAMKWKDFEYEPPDEGG